MSIPVRRVLPLLLAMLAALAVAAAPASADHRNNSGGKYGATVLKLDQGAVDALTGLGVAPAPIAPARAVSPGVLAFPIVNSFGDALRTGQIRHSGGISLTAGATTVPLKDFYIDPVKQELTADVGGTRLAILKLDFSKARVSFRGKKVVIGPVAGTLTPGAAGALDSAFGLPSGTVPPGLKLGDAFVKYRLYGRR